MNIPLPPMRLRGFDIAHLAQLKQTKSVPHAFLFSGLPGLGKDHIASHCAAILLCEQHAAAPCGHCQGCRWQQAGTHPDYHDVRPEEKSVAIKIAQVRAMMPFLQQTPQQAGFRVVIINPVDLLTIEAANSLLKTLEEPGPNTVLFLVTAHPMLLPATLRSRCVHVVFQVPALVDSCAWLQQVVSDTGVAATEADCQQWLLASEGVPLTALTLATDSQYSEQRQAWLVALQAVFRGIESPVAVAQTWATQAVIDDLLKQWITACYGLIGSGYDYQRYMPADWSALVTHRRIDAVWAARLFEFIESLIAARRTLHSHTHPNIQLLLESLLVKWYGLASK